MLIEVPHAAFGYARRPVVRVDNLGLHEGRSLGLFGPNGSGKTTLVRGLMGLLTPLEGNVIRKREELDFGYLPQHRALDQTTFPFGRSGPASEVSAGIQYQRKSQPLM